MAYLNTNHAFGKVKLRIAVAQYVVEGCDPNKTTGFVELPAREAYACAAKNNAAPLRMLDPVS